MAEPNIVTTSPVAFTDGIGNLVPVGFTADPAGGFALHTIEQGQGSGGSIHQTFGFFIPTVTTLALSSSPTSATVLTPAAGLFVKRVVFSGSLQTTSGAGVQISLEYNGSAIASVYLPSSVSGYSVGTVAIDLDWLAPAASEALTINCPGYAGGAGGFLVTVETAATAEIGP